MASKKQAVQIGKHRIQLSNLDKVLYPKNQVVKAQIIEYYLKISPTILSHIKGRPLSLVRFPDGIGGESFFQKNTPGWAPEWLEVVALGSEKKKDYIMATEQASMVWLANLACLELHQMHSRKPHFDKPDYFVFDLDPPEGYDFERIIELAYDLRDHIERYDYRTFIKTSGGKGLHIYVPVEPKWDFNTCFEHAQEIARAFIKVHSASTTLHIKKESRKGRVLIDIYRNRQSQTILGPYSLRGNEDATISMPLTWDQMGSVKSPLEFTINTVMDHVLEHGDAWSGMGAYAVPLHNHRKKVKKKSTPLPSDKYKTPDQLQEYAKKRTFANTPEPAPYSLGEDQRGFVVHRHDASRMHYDLRLEQNGALRSWAIPKGLPPYPGVKRLAVSTEDHPIEYLTFEGAIPKGQYGGGNMWIYALGKYEITKEKKNGFYFRLESPQMSGEYRIHQMKDKDWLLERVDLPQVNWLKEAVTPMLSESLSKPPEGDQYIYEVKWDGIRALIHIDEEELIIRTRNHKDITSKFPELNIAESAFKTSSVVLDAEIVCLDPEGRPDFKKVIGRMQKNGETNIIGASKRSPAYCYVFDCIFLDGRPIHQEPLDRRRAWIKSMLRRDTPYRMSEAVEDGISLFEAAREMELEGIMAKDRNSKYVIGRRSPNWFKVKVRNTADVVIIGYTHGKGDRASLFGALQIAEMDEKGGLHYRGKVGTGFDHRTMKAIHTELEGMEEVERPVKEKPLDNAETTWIKPEKFCEIQYASLTKNNTYREPVFKRMRPDLQPL